MLLIFCIEFQIVVFDMVLIVILNSLYLLLMDFDIPHFLQLLHLLLLFQTTDLIILTLYLMVKLVLIFDLSFSHLLSLLNINNILFTPKISLLPLLF